MFYFEVCYVLYTFSNVFCYVLISDLVIGAPGSDSVVMLKSNPTISMEVSLKTSLINPVNVIQDDDERFAIQVCFKYTGDKSSPPDVSKFVTVYLH